MTKMKENINTTDAGVVINGVKWATRNVDKPGTFATNPEDAGMFYQWNSKVGWPSTGDIGSITATDGTTTWNNGLGSDYINQSASGTWERPNDPSPKGWRVPTFSEIQSLLDTEKVNHTWIIRNGIYGAKFTDKTSGNSLFLPASGGRYYIDGSLMKIFPNGYYWISKDYNRHDAFALNFSRRMYRVTCHDYFNLACCFSIRSVVE